MRDKVIKIICWVLLALSLITMGTLAVLMLTGVLKVNILPYMYIGTLTYFCAVILFLKRKKKSGKNV